MYSAQQVAAATSAPLANVEQSWPLIVKALAAQQLGDDLVLIAAAATIAVETGTFLPIPEYGSGQEYEGRTDLGNVQPGDGARYKGRGFIQLTGRANYYTYSSLLSLDLVGHPELALDPHVAARIFALYFKRSNAWQYAHAHDWAGVRRAVNGGLNGWEAFSAVVSKMQVLPTGAVATRTIWRVFEQRDALWAAKHLGTSSSATIGQYGCYLSCFAMMAEYYGHAVYPNRLNDLIVQHGGFVDEDMLVDTALQSVYSDCVHMGSFDYTDVPADLAHLVKLAQDKRQMIALELDFDYDPSDGLNRHWVLLVSFDGTTLRIADPWFGGVNVFSKHYGHDKASTLLKYVVYTGKPR